VTGALRSELSGAHGLGRKTDAQKRDDVNEGAYNPEKRFAYAMLGALFDFPDLMQDPDVRPALGVLEGDVALALVATRNQWLQRRSGSSEISLDVADFLATLPLPIQRFAAGRLASPIFDTPAEAKANLLENAANLERSLERRQRSAKVSLLERSTSSYDADGEAALREIAQAARKRRGLD
jgi:DNA primase